MTRGKLQFKEQTHALKKSGYATAAQIHTAFIQLCVCHYSDSLQLWEHRVFFHRALTLFCTQDQHCSLMSRLFNILSFPYCSIHSPGLLLTACCSELFWRQSYSVPHSFPKMLSTARHNCCIKHRWTSFPSSTDTRGNYIVPSSQKNHWNTLTEIRGAC